ncbi:MAG: patatin-like phospholipase family protein [Deltaproteobacteria bacterium]|nr:patatin-like phospholipase family protein [Deltaproteobacteria bacterium]
MFPGVEIERGRLAIVMSGGGARAAYQVGLLQALAKHRPELELDILTGVSAGAINAAHLAGHPGSFAAATDALGELWLELSTDKVFRTDWLSLFNRVLRSGFQLVSGGRRLPGRPRGMVDTEPLRRFLYGALTADPAGGVFSGIAENLARGRLRAVAVTTSSYSAGTSVTWVEGEQIEPWRRSHRMGVSCQLTVEHVMASTSLPLLFPSVVLGGEWHGDGGIRLSAPLSPAVHLGARRILAISTRHQSGIESAANAPMIDGYPPPAQIAGALINALFLDLIDADALRLERINELLARTPEDHRDGLEPVELLLMRPSEDLGALANDYEPQLPRGFRFLTRGLGTRQTRSNDFLSLVMFQPDYLQELIALGRADAESRLDELLAFTEPVSAAM